MMVQRRDDAFLSSDITPLQQGTGEVHCTLEIGSEAGVKLVGGSICVGRDWAPGDLTWLWLPAQEGARLLEMSQTPFVSLARTARASRWGGVRGEIV